jgi:hypothetical protein
VFLVSNDEPAANFLESHVGLLVKGVLHCFGVLFPDQEINLPEIKYPIDDCEISLLFLFNHDALLKSTDQNASGNIVK